MGGALRAHRRVRRLPSRARRGPLTGCLAWAWRRLSDSRGGVEIGALAGELGCSRKHLIARFREQVGLPPKTIARILRFREGALDLQNGGGDRLAEVAQDCGYYDQAHLNRDFREFAGLTPTEFLDRRLPGGRHGRRRLTRAQVKSVQGAGAGAAYSAPHVIPFIYYEDSSAAIEWLKERSGSRSTSSTGATTGRSSTRAAARLGDESWGAQSYNMKSVRELGGSNQGNYVVIEDTDAHYERAKAAGAEILEEPHDKDYGSRDYTARDLEGNVWVFGTYDPFATT